MVFKSEGAFLNKNALLVLKHLFIFNYFCFFLQQITVTKTANIICTALIIKIILYFSNPVDIVTSFNSVVVSIPPSSIHTISLSSWWNSNSVGIISCIFSAYPLISPVFVFLLDIILFFLLILLLVCIQLFLLRTKAFWTLL